MKLLQLFTLATAATAMSLRRQEPISHVEPADTIFHTDPDLLQPDSSFSLSVKVPIPDGGAHYNRLQQRWYVHADPNARRDAESFFRKRSIGHVAEDIAAHGGLEGWTRDPTDVFKYLMRNDSGSVVESPSGYEEYKLVLTPSDVDMLDKGLSSEPSLLYKGTAYRKLNVYDQQTGDVAASYRKVGWARIMVKRAKDEEEPLVEGAWMVDDPSGLGVPGTVYHISDQESFKAMANADPEQANAEMKLMKRAVANKPTSMLVWRESDAYTKDLESPTDYSFVTKEMTILSKRQSDIGGGGSSSGLALSSTIGDTSGCPNHKQIALIGAAADCNYMKDFNSTESVRANILANMNTISQLYEQSFNISLGLKALVLANSTNCPSTAVDSSPWNYECTATDQNAISDRLSAFSRWRGDRSGDGIAAWTLFTDCAQGSTVGLSWLGVLCGARASQQGNTWVAGTNVVAKTSLEWKVWAHELGHIFGAVHDCTSQTCSDGTVDKNDCCPMSTSACNANGQWIMNPASGQRETTFSECTKGNICAGIGRNSLNTTCLIDNTGGIKLLTENECGNGIVEEGEDCDCGGEEGCRGNTCCDPKTCKFREGAVCDDANQACCNQCQFAPTTQECRASKGPCDPAEFCSGNSSSCPPDLTTENGKSCEDPSRPGFGGLQCIAGLCTSRDLQCFTLMQNRTTLVGNTPANVTQACDSGRCSISCRDPNLPNVCFGSQYNFLDGTPCGRGGKCLRGQCSGNTNDYFRSWFDDAGGWISRNTGAFIGIIVGVVGGIILLILLGLFRRWRHNRRAVPVYPAKNNYVRRAPPPPPPMGRNRGAPAGGNGGNMYPPPPPAQYPFKYESRQSQQYPSQDVYPPAAPPPSYSRQCDKMPRRDRYCADDMAVDTDDDVRDTEMGDSVILSRNRDTREDADLSHNEDEVLEDENEGLDDELDDDDDDPRAGVSGGGAGGASGLLRSLAGEMGGMSWHMNFQADRVRELLENVRQAEDATVMLILLQEISEVLLMSNQDILLYSFPVDNLCAEMAGIMTNPLFEDSQDCAIMACRTLYNLWEVSPTVSSNICSAGIAKILADKLTNLTDVDFAEQAMQLLEKLSSDHPESPGHAEHLLRQGCLRAALIHLDFFATHVQRSAVNIAANCCKYLSASMFDQIQEVMPILANTLTSSDQKVVERGSQAVARTIERLGKSCDEEDVSFEAIVSSELVTQLTALLVHGDSAAQRTVLQTLAIIARHSDSLAAEIVKADITGVLLRILGNSGSEKLLTALVKAPPQLIEECVKLIFALLPDAVTMQGFPDGPFRTSRASPTRAEVLKQLPNYNSFCSSTLHLLFELFAATMAVRVKRKIVYSVIRLLAAAPSDTVVALPEVAVFISSVLNQSEDDSLILGAVDMSIFLIENHSAVFGPLFASEGILDQIAAIPPPPKSNNKFGALSADSDEDEEDDIVYDFSCNLKHLLALYVQKFQSLVESNSVATDNNSDLIQIAELLDGPDFKQGLEMLQSRLPTMSTFQLTHSDVVVSLLQALTVENSHGDLVERRRQFLETFCSNKASLESFAVLVDKLLEGLARTERFEVLTSGLPDSGNLETTLGKQVRLNLVAERGTDLPKQYCNMFVSIHAIATFKAVDDFFRSKVQTSLAFEQRMSSFMRRRFRGSGGSGGGTLEQALSAIAAATGMPLPSGSIVGEESDSEEDEDGEGENDDGIEDDEEQNEDDEEEDDDESLDFGEEEEVGGDEDEEIVEDDVGVVNGDSDIEIDENEEEQEGERPAGEAEDGEDGEEGSTSRSYADAASSSAGPKWHLTFSINGQEVTHETTVFGALLKACGSPNEIWSTNFTINIKKTKGAPPVVDEPKFESEDIVPYLQSPESFSDSPRAATIMQLLSALYNVNLWSGEIAGSVYNLNPSHFLSSKLTAKFNKQLEEPLIVASLCLPAWTVDATRLYPFLFPFDVRHRYLESTSFGYSRSIQKWEEHYRERRSNNGNDSSSSSRDRNDRPPIGKLIRQKVRISRKHMFQSAIKVMELYGSSPSVLEVEYFDEVGTGLGPTLEFYATVSHQFAHKSLEMWRDDTPTSGSGGSEAFAFSQQGLFPIPLITCSNPEKVLNRFKVLGTFVARSMIDSRLIDIHFSTTFFRLACLQLSFSPTSETLVAIDEQLGKSLRQLQKMSPDEIEHLGLDFTLPGFAQAELKPNGSQISVTGDNVQEYIDLIVDQTVGSGVSQQIEAFKAGFSEVFPFSAVCAFSPAELVLMCGPSVEDWSLDTLSEAVHADHGFDQRSKTFMNLLEVMSEFDESQRRQFLSFVTGSPKLPIGGFKALKPGLTVVRKASENGLGPDDYLPSVMTCVNYLKCPDFSTKELLKSRLLQAISEGGGAFHLS